MIATRQFQVGEVLPSTRVLGKQLGASFHTVRKAYQLLAEEGLLRSEQGRGFVVNSPLGRLDKSERLETGAGKFRELLEELIGYGLDEEEVETLFQEQLNFMDWPERIKSCATVGQTYELAHMHAQAIRRELGIKSTTILPTDQSRAVHFDALFTPVAWYHQFVTDSSEALILPVVFHPSYDTITALTERSNISSLGLAAVERKTLELLEKHLRPVLAPDIEIQSGVVETRAIPSFVHQVDLVFYTESCARAIESRIPERRRRKITFELSPRSAEIIRSELWDEM